MGQERLRIVWLNKKDRSILYAKFSLMELARAGDIDLVRVKPSSFDRRILPPRAIDALSPAQAFFVAYRGSRQCRVILDTSESFLYMSSAIADVDLYFCSAYSSEIFEAHRFLTPYPWQERYNLNGYKKHFSRIEQEFGSYFDKIVRFIPYPVVMDLPARRFNRTEQAAIVFLLISRFLRKYFSRLRLGAFDPEYLLLKMRYQQLVGYRLNQLKYDIVVRESLWAWPWHRVLLYKTLGNLAGRKVVASLSSQDADNPEAWWRQGVPEDEIDEVVRLLQEKPEFPESYEDMITSSRLAVFPTGKHWGWRAITFLSLISGGPILMDRPIFEPYFPLDDFKIYYDNREWSDLATILDQVTPEQWNIIRKHNQAAFDKYLAPRPVGRYICRTIQNWFETDKGKAS